MNSHNDPDLWQAFQALGAQGRARVPSFQQLTSHEALTGARWRRRRRLAALGLVAVAIPAALTLRTRPDQALDYERFTALTGLDLGEVTWEAPSDFLLDFPGRDVLGALPVMETQAPALVPDNAGSSDSSNIKRRSRS
jgi:hypothetical protein